MPNGDSLARERAEANVIAGTKPGLLHVDVQSCWGQPPKDDNLLAQCDVLNCYTQAPTSASPLRHS